ncbi:hypothetical protein DBR42_05580 [Pelomonas sp. HMWF004]|nr:hypothetical protein DBR42_05580 [Pelomonas sp. HMWF004]
MSWEHQGQLIGVCVDAARHAFAAIGLELKVEPAGPWSRCQLMVETGQVDVNLCGFATDKRRAYAVMVEPPVGQNEAVLIVRRSSTLVYKSWADLQDLRIGMGRGVSFGSEFDSYLAQHAKLDIAPSESRNLQKLALDRLDAVITARIAGQYMMRALGCEEQLRMLPDTVVEGQLYMQMSKRSKHLPVLPQLTAFLQQPAQTYWLRNLRARTEARYYQLNPVLQDERCSR